jgi:hypothetical protein
LPLGPKASIYLNDSVGAATYPCAGRQTMGGEHER